MVGVYKNNGFEECRHRLVFCITNMHVICVCVGVCVYTISLKCLCLYVCVMCVLVYACIATYYTCVDAWLCVGELVCAVKQRSQAA